MLVEIQLAVNPNSKQFDSIGGLHEMTTYIHALLGVIRDTKERYLKFIRVGNKLVIRKPLQSYMYIMLEQLCSVLSSAKLHSSVYSIKYVKSLINILNNKGPKIEP